MNFKKLLNLGKYKKSFRLILFAIILYSVPYIALAQSQTQVIQTAFDSFSLILQAMQAAMWPILILMGGLLNNDLLFSGGMSTVLLNIWAVVRDFVNILFVLGLLALAIVNILGFIENEDFSMNKALPKIAVALIAVNFSFFACKIILDVVNVTTTAIYSIPLASDQLKKYEENKTSINYLSEKFCNKIMDIKGMEGTENMFCEPAGTNGNTASSTDTTTGSKVEPLKYKLKSSAVDFFSNFNSRNAGLVMAFELMDISNIDTVNLKEVKDVKTLTVQTIFAIIFLTIYVTAFIALFAVMLVRVVILWIAIATSPISFLGIPFKSFVGSKLGDNDPFFKLFMKHAFIPIQVSVVLTIGMIMISQLKQTSPNLILSTNPANLGAITAGGTSTLQDLIAGLATAAFIWLAAFMALKGTKADFIVDAIQGQVRRFGTNLAKLPAYVPIIPTAQGKVGLAALTAGGLGGGLEQYIQDQDRDIREKFGSPSEKAKSTLESVRGSEDIKQKIAKALNQVDYRLNPASQAVLADKLDKYYKDFIPPSRYNGNKKAFLEDLKAGKVTPEDLREFATESNTSIAKARGEQAKKEAQSALNIPTSERNTAIPELTDAVTKLNRAVDELRGNEDKEDKVRKVEEETRNVEAMRKAASAVYQAGSDIISESGAIAKPAGAESFKENYDKLPPAAQEAAKKALIRKFTPKVGGDNAKATQIVEDILERGERATGIEPSGGASDTSGGGAGGTGAGGAPAGGAGGGAPAGPGGGGAAPGGGGGTPSGGAGTGGTP